MAWLRREDPFSDKGVDRYAELFSRRLAEVTKTTALEDADPDEVESRIRNLTHGTRKR